MIVSTYKAMRIRRDLERLLDTLEVQIPAIIDVVTFEREYTRYTTLNSIYINLDTKIMMNEQNEEIPVLQVVDDRRAREMVMLKGSNGMMRSRNLAMKYRELQTILDDNTAAIQESYLNTTLEILDSEAEMLSIECLI